MTHLYGCLSCPHWQLGLSCTPYEFSGIPYQLVKVRQLSRIAQSPSSILVWRAIWETLTTTKITGMFFRQCICTIHMHGYRTDQNWAQHVEECGINSNHCNLEVQSVVNTVSLTLFLFFVLIGIWHLLSLDRRRWLEINTGRETWNRKGMKSDHLSFFPDHLFSSLSFFHFYFPGQDSIRGLVTSLVFTEIFFAIQHGTSL